MSAFSAFRPGCKVWLEKEGAVFGEGLYSLLLRIGRTGSIAGAASEMGMSYRAAWGKIRLAEKRLNIKLVSTRVGGDAGGGTGLTGEARALLVKYQKLRDAARDMVLHLYENL